MYTVTSDYKEAIKKPIIFSNITFTLSEDNTVYTDANILEGSFTITNQCTDTKDITLGSVYVGELKATLRGINLPRNNWVKKSITPVFHLRLEDDTYEAVPLGIYTISEATWTRSGVEITAYDDMDKLDKNFSMTQSSGYLYDFLVLAADECGVTLEQTEEQLKALPNGNIFFTFYKDNDVETWRDLVYWVAQTNGGFATINRNGNLEIRLYKDPTEADDELDTRHRHDGGQFSDYTTSYTGLSYVDLATGYTRYVGAEVDTGATLNLGSNPFLQDRNHVDEATAAILEQILKIQYTPFKGTKINDPAYDLGDLLVFTGGIAGEESVCCLQKYVFQYHRKYEMAGYGSNPAQATARSKVDKNISGLLNNVKGDVMQFYEYRNASRIKIDDGVNRQVFRLRIASTADTRVQIHININLGITATDAEPTAVICTYTIDGQPVSFKPKATYYDGNHVLHLMYILPISANIITNFRLYLELDGGSAEIERQGLWVYASGYGIVGDATWDGTFDIEEVPEPIDIIRLPYAAVTESVVIDTDAEDVGDSYSDTTEALTITDPTEYAGATDNVVISRFNTAYLRETEDGEDERILENEDGATTIVRYTEEEF